MKLRIYNFLVNKQPGIRERYHQFHDDTTGIRKYASWFYLLALNFGYYVLRLHFLGSRQDTALYEEKKLLTDSSESQAAVSQLPTPQDYIDKLSQYDVISFDIFDTLIFRPFSEPTDLFFFVGDRLSFMDFKRIRIEMEYKARQRCYAEQGHYEVTLAAIWALMEEETGIDAKKGMLVEQELEKQFCYANPFMKQVYDALIVQGRTVVIVSDMYLPFGCLEEILKCQGFDGYQKLYVSCEYGRNKASGALYTLIQNDIDDDSNNNGNINSNRIIHVGDNPMSDQHMAKYAGWDIMPYINVNRNAAAYRAYDMSAIIGGAYRGLVQNHIWSGKKVYSMEYEYGYIYGGLFAVGYCQFVHEYVRTHHMDKVLFLSRDGDVLKQVYDRLYPEENTAYVYWSRRAAAKLMAVYDKYDYFRRFVYHKVNQGYTFSRVLEAMELSKLAEVLFKDMARQFKNEQQDVELGNLPLTEQNADWLVMVLKQHWSEVLSQYEPEQRAAKQYYSEVLKGCQRVCAVDIGWAGSGAMALSYLVEQHWKMQCEVFGIVAGTNTVHNVEPDASESFLQSGKMVSYLYSQSQNRDLLKKHDLNRDFNVYWELLLASPTRQFLGFNLKNEEQVKLAFGKYDKNQDGIRRIQQGIFDFAEDYKKHFGNFPYMLQISGRDAYAPMLVAASNKERYLKKIKKRFSLEVHVE